MELRLWCQHWRSLAAAHQVRHVPVSLSSFSVLVSDGLHHTIVMLSQVLSASVPADWTWPEMTSSSLEASMTSEELSLFLRLKCPETREGGSQDICSAALLAAVSPDMSHFDGSWTGSNGRTRLNVRDHTSDVDIVSVGKLMFDGFLVRVADPSQLWDAVVSLQLSGTSLVLLLTRWLEQLTPEHLAASGAEETLPLLWARMTQHLADEKLSAGMGAWLSHVLLSSSC